MKLDFFLISFIALTGYLAIFVPISGYYEIKKLKKSLELGAANKVKFFKEIILWSWLPIILIALLLLLTDMNLGDIGIKWIDISSSSLNTGIVYSLIGLSLLYFGYNIYLIILLRTNEKIRKKTAATVPKNAQVFLPITKQEKKVWRFVALSFGTTEEIVYRGYFFYALAFVFPELSIFYILLIVTLLFGLGHIYQGKEVIKPTILGLFFGIFYIVFDSILPLIILHIVGDLVATDILEEENE